MTKRSWLTGALSAWIAISFCTAARAGWGVDSGRANEHDVFALHDDWTTIEQSLQRLRDVASESSQRGRYLQLLGIVEGQGRYTDAQLIEMYDEWIEKNVDMIFTRIASNPAASCAEASQMLRHILDSKRNLQVHGTEAADNVVGTKLWETVRQRCREEKLDECNMTGRFEQIVEWQADEEKQLQLYGIGADDAWAIAALKECAIYELHYVSEGDINDEFKLHTLVDGRIPIKVISDQNPVTSIQALLAKPPIEGETDSDVNPFLQTVDCGAPPPTAITCSPGGGVKRAAWAGLLDLELKYREYEIGNNGEVTQATKGENKLQLKFLPAMLSITALIKTREGNYPMPFIEAGGTAFYIAHKANRVEEGKVLLNPTSTGVYPVLFEFEIEKADQEDGVKASDRTRFELIHKPQKKPFPARPSQPRAPLEPRS